MTIFFMFLHFSFSFWNVVCQMSLWYVKLDEIYQFLCSYSAVFLAVLLLQCLTFFFFTYFVATFSVILVYFSFKYFLIAIPWLWMHVVWIHSHVVLNKLINAWRNKLNMINNRDIWIIRKVVKMNKLIESKKYPMNTI